MTNERQVYINGPLTQSLKYAGLDGLITATDFEAVLARTLAANLHLTHEEDDIWGNFQVTPGRGFPMPLAAQSTNAEEAFSTTSSYCILPISMIDGWPVGESYPGPVAGRLLKQWSEKVSVDIVAQSRRFGDRG